MLGEVLKALEFIGGVTIILGLAVVFWLSLTKEKTKNQEKEALNMLNSSYSFVKVSQYDAFVAEGQILILIWNEIVKRRNGKGGDFLCTIHSIKIIRSVKPV